MNSFYRGLSNPNQVKQGRPDYQDYVLHNQYNYSPIKGNESSSFYKNQNNNFWIDSNLYSNNSSNTEHLLRNIGDIFDYYEPDSSVQPVRSGEKLYNQLNRKDLPYIMDSNYLSRKKKFIFPGRGGIFSNQYNYYDRNVSFPISSS